MQAADTIAAIATPPGRGGVGMIRVSGPAAGTIARALLGRVPEARRARFARFRDGQGELIDEGLALYFPAPRSFTGEDVLELHGHGGPVVLDLLMQAVLAAGARPARPGEFSERAFLNDKLDLAQAEAVADLIDSASAQAARAALRSLRGDFSSAVRALDDALIELRMYVEAAIDFPDEDVEFLQAPELARRVEDARRRFEAIETRARQGALLREGATLVIAGRPNAGKSSLLNALAGYEAAIVTEIPGTTRDLLRERILLDGVPLHVVDTAGLRDSTDRVEQEGIRRARAAIDTADALLLVVDDARGWSEDDARLLRELDARLTALPVFNKIDLTGRRAGDLEWQGRQAVAVSAQTGAGLDALREGLRRIVGVQDAEAGSYSARRRHLEALRQARDHMEEGLRLLESRQAGELFAEELRLAHQALGEITGRFSSEDLLGRIFSSFCIGK